MSVVKFRCDLGIDNEIVWIEEDRDLALSGDGLSRRLCRTIMDDIEREARQKHGE